MTIPAEDDFFCHVCGALITAVGADYGVFCLRGDCPGDRLSQFDVTNVCAENTFCLNFTGERVEVRADTSPPATPEPAKKPRRKTPLAQPTLFDA